jgi:tetratricopeptide (TPR) repeat protein
VADLLRQVPGLSLTAPTLVAEVLSRNPSLDLRALARNLGVDAILTWNMRRLGDSLHVRAELVSGGDGRIVWGSSYDRAMTDLPRLESEIARALVDTLGVARSNLARAGMERRRNVDPGAYDAYLRGYHVWLTATPLGARGAREKADSIGLYARRALTLDSTFTGGYILLGAYYSVSAIRGWRTPLATVLDSARTILEKALSRDSAMADPWILLGLLDFYSTDEFARAGARLRRGVSLNPDLVTGQQFYGIYLAEVERQLDSAAAHFEQAIKRDPQNQLFNSLGDIMMRARRYDSAVVLLRHGIAVDSVPPGPHNRLIQSLEALQDYPAAIEARRRAPDSTGAGRFAAAFAKSGASGYLRERAAELRRRADAITAAPLPEHGTVADSIPPLRENRLALLYLQLGEPAKAMDWIEREYQRRPRRFRLYYAHPDFDQLHQDPRFQALARKEGLLE